MWVVACASFLFCWTTRHAVRAFQLLLRLLADKIDDVIALTHPPTHTRTNPPMCAHTHSQLNDSHRVTVYCRDEEGRTGLHHAARMGE